MLFVIYGILLLGGIVVVGISFAVPVPEGLELIRGLIFIGGVLLIAAAVAVPITAGANEHRK